jgi:hypothetical protein
MKNPWLDFWLSTANSITGAARGFWAPELRQLQKVVASATARASGPEPVRKETARKRRKKA